MSVELFSNRLLSALFNGGYQGLLLTAMIWAGLKLFPRANAATRHAVWFITLLIVAAMPVIHFLLPERVSKTVAVVKDAAATGAGAASAHAAGPVEAKPGPAMVPQVFNPLTSLPTPGSGNESPADTSLWFFAPETLNQTHPTKKTV